MKTSIYALAAAAFAVVTTEFSIVGILPAVAQALDVSISQAGLLVTLFAFVVALTGPFLTAFASRFERKTLFIVLLTLMAVGNFIGALAESYTVMLIARLLPAFALPVFWSIATTSAAQIAGDAQAGKAISIVFYGVSAATVLGMPLGTLIADAFDWRLTFVAVGLLCVLMAVVIAVVFPRMTASTEQNAVTDWSILKDASVIGHLALSGAILTALFTAYTYLADVLQNVGHFSGSMTGWILMAFGTVGLLGNWIAGSTVDKHPMKTPLVAAAIAAVGMGTMMAGLAHPVYLAVALALWGIAQSASFVSNHVRVVKAVPQAAELAASLNVSVYNLGIGLGALIGGAVVDNAGLEFVGLSGAGILVLTFIILAVLRVAMTSKPQTQQAL